MRSNGNRSILPTAPSWRWHRISPVALVPAILLRRAAIFALIALVVIGLGAAVIYGWQSKAALLFVGLIGGAVADTLIISLTLATFEGAGIAAGLSRALERAWAVIVINFVMTYIFAEGIGAIGVGNIVDRILGIILLLFAASLIFAEVIAVTIDDERWWMLVPSSVGTSVRISWTGSVMWRVLALFALAIVPTFLESGLGDALTKAHVSHPDFWGSFPLSIVWSIPLNVLTTLVFFDVTGYEPKNPCDE